jgi:hypothetical protein
LRKSSLYRLPVDEQQVIARARRWRDFTQRYATCGGEIYRLVILDDPTTRGQLRVDLLTGALFGG